MPHSSRRLGEILVQTKVLSRDTLAELLQQEERDGTPLPHLLAETGIVSRRDLLAAIAKEAGFGYADLAADSDNQIAASLLQPEVAWRQLALPTDLDADRLVVAMADPGDIQARKEVELAAGMPVIPLLADRRELLAALQRVYGHRVDVLADQAEAAPVGDDGSAQPRETLLEQELGEAGFSEGAGAESVVTSSRPVGPSVLDFDPVGEVHLDEMLQVLVKRGGSDLHLSVGTHPAARVDGNLIPLTEFPVMTGSEIRRMIYAVLTQRQRERFEEDLELDLSHAVPGLGRFRVNLFLQRDSMGAVMRAIPFEVVPFEKLGLPEAVLNFGELPRGLVLVTGPTGSGKSTTLASLINHINATKPVHIMTIEDPIEFLHRHQRAIINQREIGEDTHSFAKALRHVLRQDPDVILVGEMRDLETIATAITAAETGHLVFGTLHTQDAPQSIDRIIDVFPAAQQTQIRVQLATALQGVVTQQLVPKSEGKGRVAAIEILVATPAVRNLIREGKTHQIYSAMQAGGQYGMQTMDMSLAGLVRKGAIALPMATERCANVEDLRRLVQGA